MTAAFFGEYETFVAGLTKPGTVIKEDLTPDQACAWHMATGVSGEAGELLDAIKKWVIYRRDLDIGNVVEELGDLEFYMAGIRNTLGIRRDDVIAANMIKLGVRYGDGYSDQAARERADKK